MYVIKIYCLTEHLLSCITCPSACPITWPSSHCCFIFLLPDSPLTTLNWSFIMPLKRLYKNKNDFINFSRMQGQIHNQWVFKSITTFHLCTSAREQGHTDSVFLSKTFESIDQEIHLIYFFRKWIGRYQWCVHWQWYIPTCSSITWCWNCGKHMRINKYNSHWKLSHGSFTGSSKILFQSKFHKWWICHWWYSRERREVCHWYSIWNSNRSVYILF